MLGRLHGRCYGQPLAVAADLAWLEQQGFCTPPARRDQPGWPAIVPPPWPAATPRPTGGLPALADQDCFVRTLTLLRHLLHHPAECQPGQRIEEHLARSLNQQAPAPQPWRAREVRELISTTLTRYGFQRPGQGGRGGYRLGMALLSRQQWIELHQQLRRLGEALADAPALELAELLAARLQTAGVELPRPPVHRRPDGAVQAQAPAPQESSQRSLLQRLEQAIALRQRLELAIRPRPGSPWQQRRCWPLQLLHHGGQWWLLLEHDPIGHPEGLLEACRLTALRWQGQRDGVVRSPKRQGQALRRAERLQAHCGGMDLGPDLGQQQLLCGSSSARDVQAEAPLLETLRLRCSSTAMALLAEQLPRFRLTCVRTAAPLPGDHWPSLPLPCSRLAASSGSSHPYPLELDLPPWVIAGDGELRRWLFSLGSGIRIEAPEALQQEHRRWLQTALALYDCPQGCQGSGAAAEAEGRTAIGTATVPAAAEASGRRRRICKQTSAPLTTSLSSTGSTRTGRRRRKADQSSTDPRGGRQS